MSITFTRPSPEQRTAILWLEAAALLHDVGKLSDAFLLRQSADNNHVNYDHQLRLDPTLVFPELALASEGTLPHNRLKNLAWPREQRTGLYHERPNLTPVLQAVQVSDWNAQQYNLAEIVLLSNAWAADMSENPLHLQVFGGRSMEPAKLIGQFHGIAHHEKPFPRRDSLSRQNYEEVQQSSPFGKESNIYRGFDQIWEDLLSVLERIAADERGEWIGALHSGLKYGLADTRRAINEVSLWDWAYAVASLTKPAAFELFQTGNWIDPGEMLFRTLIVSLDQLAVTERADKITDLVGAQAVMQQAFERLRTLLEEDYAIGNRIYADETGQYFLLPALNDDQLPVIRQAVANIFPFDLRPAVGLGQTVKARELDPGNNPAGYRTAVRKLIMEPRQMANSLSDFDTTDNFQYIPAIWTSHRPANAEICSVIRYYPVGFPSEASQSELEHLDELDFWSTEQKAAERKISRIALQRRGRRSSTWLTDERDGTIWLDEAADDTGRLALLVATAGIEPWLSGDVVESLAANLPTGGTFVTKTASPARLLRIATTAKRFWTDFKDDVLPSLLESEREGRARLRIRLTQKAVQANNHSELGHGHAYEFNIDGRLLGVVWDANEQAFLTTTNLAYFIEQWHPDAALEEFVEAVQHSDRELRAPSGFLTAAESLTVLPIASVEVVDEAYLPLIPILAEPSIFMGILPASMALTAVNRLHAHYQEEIGRVADRLPIHVGLVYFRRRTPLTAVLQAGKRFRNRSQTWERWTVAAKDARRITFANGRNTFDHTFPTTMGDGETRDAWYPRLFTADPDSSRDSAATTPQPQTALVDDLQIGQAVYIRPSSFDFELLDTAGRRFEITYEQQQRVRGGPRPYLLAHLPRLDEIWQSFKGLSISQRQQVVSTIETTRDLWHGREPEQVPRDPVFRQFVHDTLAGANWPGRWTAMSQDARAVLCDAGVAGELADLLELHFEIMKQREPEEA